MVNDVGSRYLDDEMDDDDNESEGSQNEQKSEIVPITTGENWDDIQRQKKGKQKRSIFPIDSFEEMPKLQLYKRKPKRRAKEISREESSSNSEIVPLD